MSNKYMKQCSTPIQKGNSNENYDKISSHSYQISNHEEQKQPPVMARMREKNEYSYSFRGNAN
jgi:hypothetical protein